MLYKYLFYASTYYIKKYDWLWNVEDLYYIWGSVALGNIIAFSMMSAMDLVGIFFWHELIWIKWKGFIYLPLVIGLIFIMYFGYKRRCDKVYEEISNLDPKTKRKYKILNIIHITVVMGLYFNAKAILAWYTSN